MDSYQHVALLSLFLMVCCCWSFSDPLWVLYQISIMWVGIYVRICLCVCLYLTMHTNILHAGVCVYDFIWSFNNFSEVVRTGSIRSAVPECPRAAPSPCSSSPGHPAAGLVCCRQKAKRFIPHLETATGGSEEISDFLRVLENLEWSWGLFLLSLPLSSRRKPHLCWF